jgi:hypothetical protein
MPIRVRIPETVEGAIANVSAISRPGEAQPAKRSDCLHALL